MAEEQFWGGQLNVDPHEALMQQGHSCRTAHREVGVASNNSFDILIDVSSACHVRFEFASTGVFHGTFNKVASVTSGSAASLDVFNLNTFFQAVNSGMQSTKMSHTASYGTLTPYWPFIVGAGGGVGNPIGGKGGGEIILGPGLWCFALQNKAGTAQDICFTATWEEPMIPNVP